MNKIFLIGRITKDIELRYSTSNKPYTKFTLAVNRKFKRDGESDADFISCTAFNKTADFINNYMRKGSQIAVVGNLQTGSYKNSEGRMVYTTDVIVSEVFFADSKKQGKQEEQGDAWEPPSYDNAVPVV